jgi:hypothetical protein
MKKILLTVVMVLAGLTIVNAQRGLLRGQLIDPESGESVIGANVYIEGTTTGTVSDFDGNYSLALEPGNYNIVFSSISYVTITVKDVAIVAGEVTALNVNLLSAVEQLEAVVVTAAAMNDSDFGVLNVKKKSVNMIDGISSQTFRKIGDSNLSTAIKRVTGVSVEGGKYVYVRGLGDRYTKTTLNGMSIPGLDPDKNSVQIDIFPTAILKNVMVYKTFSPNLYGDFTGGAIDIETKEFPEEKTISFSLGVSMIPGVQFNDNFMLYQGGQYDWLGFDDGTRSLSFPKETVIPAESAIDPQLEVLTRSFNPQMAVERQKALPGGSISFNMGNQIDRHNMSLGYNIVLNYQNTYQFYDEVQSNNFLKDPDKSEPELLRDESRNGVIGKQNVLWSGLLSGALKSDKHSFSISVLRSQNGESTASSRVNQNFNQTGARLLEDILTYSQRSVTNTMLIGKHSINKVQIEWRGAMNWSRVYDPDFRITAISVSGTDTTLNIGDGAGINRFYRDLTEINGSFKADVTIPFAIKSKLKFGGVSNYRERNFEILSFLFRQRGVGQVANDPNWFFQEENIWTPEGRKGTYVLGNFEPTNSFYAQQWTHAAYLMSELYATPEFRAIFGVRAEQSTMYYTGENNDGSVVYDNEQTLIELDFLPSLNLVYSIGENMNLRGSFNQTLARPSLKEKSISQIFDPISRRTFIGNIDLKQTNINNIDLRWEYFLRGGELISISGFYKSFANHIELVSFPTDPDAIKPRNAGESWVYGAEFELRKGLEFITPALRDVTIGFNFSLVRSFVDMNTVFVDNNGATTEKELREASAREGEIIQNTRSMAGQAPYLVNGYVNYTIPSIALNLNLVYNVQGETLAVVGSGVVSDVYSVPFHSLSLNAYKGFGGAKRSRVTLGVDNILGAIRQQEYRSFGAQNQIYTTYNPGTEISLQYSFTF